MRAHTKQPRSSSLTHMYTRTRPTFQTDAARLEVDTSDLVASEREDMTALPSIGSPGVMSMQSMNTLEATDVFFQNPGKPGTMMTPGSNSSLHRCEVEGFGVLDLFL